VFSIQMYTRKSAAFRNALKFNRPISQFLMCPDIDDCVGPARAAKYAKLSDRSSRRLFDRLVELGAARELTGRSSFRLYGL
ncbi:hypothetical protein C5688_11955, partial [Methylocystis sp. MitZ-2018]